MRLQTLLKKISFIILTFFATTSLVFSASNLWEYYGGKIPSFDERKEFYEEVLADEEYRGTAEQNDLYLQYLQGQQVKLGATILYPSGGGTGTSTAPTYGQMLVGNSGGTYTLTATSSLGISGGSGTFSWTPATNYGENTNSTTTAIWVRENIYASSTIYAPNFTAESTTATSTLPLLEVSTQLKLGSDYITDITGTNLSITNGVLSASGSGSGTVGTSTNETAGSMAYWTSNSATPALLGMISTTTPTMTAPLTYSGTIGSFVGGVAGAFDCTSATGSVKGCLTSADWTTFNDKADLGSAMTGTFDGNNFAGGAIGAGELIYGGSAGSFSELALGTNGYVLALAGGIPAWVATTTLSTITGTLAVAKGGTGQTSFGQGWLHSDGTTFTSSTSPTVNYITATSTTATSTFAGPLIFTGTGGTNQIKIDPNFAFSNSTSIGGAILLENTGNSGAGFVMYTNAGAEATGRLLPVRCGNSAFDQDCLNITYAGTQAGLSISGTGGQGMSISHSGSGHAAGINYTGTGATSAALNLTSINQSFTTLGVSGYETGHGTIKVTHLGGEPSDANAAALSIDLTSTSTQTAAQGIFITSTTGGTTGNLITLRNPQDIFTVRSTGNVGIWDSGADASLEIVATTTQDILNISSTANADGDLLTMLFSGYLGIGTTSPYAKLSVVGETVAEKFTATSTTATSTLPRLSITTGISILGEYFENFTTYVRSLFTAGTGINISSGSISATLGTSVDLASEITGTLPVGNGGTGQTSFGQGWLHSDGTTLTSSTSPTVAWITATSTTATSTFAGGIDLTSSTGMGLNFGSSALFYQNNQRFLTSSTTAAGNLTIGYQSAAGLDANGGLYNTGVGYQALGNATSTKYNTALGYQALKGSATISGTGTGNNTAVGYQALLNNTTGTNNAAVGSYSLQNNTTGTSNMAFGTNSLRFNTTGTGNAAIGVVSLLSNTTGSQNIGLGESSFYYNTTGTGNVGIGYYAGVDTASIPDRRSVIDTYMTFIGNRAGRSESVASTTALTNGTAIGLSAKVAQSNAIVLGGTGAYAVNVAIGTTTPWAKLSILNTYGSQTPLFDIASSTSAAYATSSVFRVNADGNVGIGTTSPAVLWDVFSTATSTMRVDSNSATQGGCIILKDTDGGGYTQVVALNGVLTATINTTGTTCN